MESEEELYSSSEELYSSSDDNNNETTMEIYYQDGNTICGRMSMENFVDVPCWAFNRPLDRKRVRELRTEILKTKCVYGVFIIARCNEEDYLIDGQHRQQALVESWGKDCNLDIPILVLIYQVDDEADMIELFKKVNNTKPLDPKETPNSTMMTTVKRLGEDYKDAIRFDKNKTVYPYVLAKTLQERLRSINLDDVTSDMLYTAIRKINKKYSNIRIKSIPNVRQRLTKATVAKAIRSGFYLGLDEKWSWIEELEDIL